MGKMFLGGMVIAVGCALATSAMAKSDKSFLKEAIKGDNSEIALGQMAAEKGSTDAVRSYGKMLVTDHGKNKTEASALAGQMDVKVPEGMTDAAKQESKKLKDLSGTAFDKEFASFMVTDHKKVISEFEAKAKEGDSKVSQMAKKTLPTLQHHLETAQSLSGM